MDMTNKLAQRNKGVEWSGIRIMFAEAEGVPDMVNLGIGQPDFNTPVHIRDAAKKGLDEGFTRYPPAKGFSDLRKAIARKLLSKNQIEADPEKEIFVAVGAMQVIFNSMLHLVETGDEVIVMDPGYDYYSQIRLFGGVPVPVPVYEENRFKLNPDDLLKAVTPKTKMIILNTPSNPTGAVLGREELQAVAKIAMEKDIWVLSDEPYEDMMFDGNAHISIGSFPGMKERTISAYTLSKSYAMTGWRVGYAAAPEAVIDEMEKLMEHMVSGVSAPAQRAALAAIESSQECVADMLAAYEKRREVVYEGINAIDGISCIKPESTFYAFINIKSLGRSSWDVARHLVKNHRIALIPGVIFGPHGEGFLRLSFAASIENLKEGLKRLEAGVETLKTK